MLMLNAKLKLLLCPSFLASGLPVKPVNPTSERDPTDRKCAIALHRTGNLKGQTGE